MATYRVLIEPRRPDPGPDPEPRLIEADDRREACAMVREALPDHQRDARLRAVLLY